MALRSDALDGHHNDNELMSLTVTDLLAAEQEERAGDDLATADDG